MEFINAIDNNYLKNEDLNLTYEKNRRYIEFLKKGKKVIGYTEAKRLNKYNEGVYEGLQSLGPNKRDYHIKKYITKRREVLGW